MCTDDMWLQGDAGTRASAGVEWVATFSQDGLPAPPALRARHISRRCRSHAFLLSTLHACNVDGMRTSSLPRARGRGSEVTHSQLTLAPIPPPGMSGELDAALSTIHEGDADVDGRESVRESEGLAL